jgi:hypothetical protein
MRIRTGGTAIVVGIVVALLAGPALAGSTDGLVFRAAGFYKGEQSITEDQITCEIPRTTTAVLDGAFAMGLWNTYGAKTLFFPDQNNPAANPCGVWVQLRNNTDRLNIILDRLKIQFRIPGANRFRNYGIATRNGFPTACRDYRKATIYAGAIVPPLLAEDQDVSNAGAPNAAFLQLLPLVSPDLINCLRGVYSSLSTNVFVSLPLVATVTGYGFADNNKNYTTNAIQYTLNLRHTCGNGRVDDGEQCDPQSPLNTCFGVCQSNVCSNDANLGCQVDSDCNGVCQAQGQPTECNCAFQ